jgi:outer membrane protein TolC
MKRVIKHSIKTAALGAAVFFASIQTVANTSLEFEDKFTVRSVNQHPDVVRKFNAIEEKALAIGQILADDSLKINLSNRSKMPWKTNTKDSEVTGRYSDVTESKHDLILTADKTLLDFGLVDNNVAAEESSKLAIKLDYLNTFELTLKKLINNAISLTRSRQSIKLIEQSIYHAESAIVQIKQRFELGTGTISQVRQAQLLLLELETSLSNLIREFENSRQILKQEFKIDSNQAKIIAKRAIDFHQSIKGSQYDIEKIDGLYVIKFQRSSEMLNHQKNAIRSQIKAVDSGNYPRLGIALTAVGYDWNHKIKEYELYGALNLSMPLYDGGTSSNKKRGLEFQIKMLLDREAALDSSKNTELNDLIDRTTKFNIEYKLSQLKYTNLEEKLQRIKQRMSASEEVLSEKLQTTLSLAKENIKITEYDYYLASMNIDFLSLAEILAQHWWKY